MAEQNSNSENTQRRFSQDQYVMLKRCADKGDMTEWNKWREDHSEYDIQDVLLEGGDFSSWNLKGVNLGTYRQYERQTAEVFLSQANFDKAHLEKSQFEFSHLEGTRFHEAHLENANMMFAYLNNSFLLGIHLENADLHCAELRNANACNAHLNNAIFIDSHLQGTEFNNASIVGAQFRIAHVDGSTSFRFCNVDRKTDFREVGLDNVQVDPATKQLLEYNIRRMNWDEWYKEHWSLQWPVRLFWWMSDYGINTWRIICCFFGLALIFAVIYANCAYWCSSEIVCYLKVEPHLPLWHYFLLLLLRPIYFSVVTMTTGFSNMYANAQSIWGHILIGIQVVLGYILLGALVTRFAVLFTAGGPAGKFSDENVSSENTK
jgi:uncharacterized protein YjbI with pentapeptide repeats